MYCTYIQYIRYLSARLLGSIHSECCEEHCAQEGEWSSALFELASVGLDFAPLCFETKVL